MGNVAGIAENFMINPILNHLSYSPEMWKSQNRKVNVVSSMPVTVYTSVDADLDDEALGLLVNSPNSIETPSPDLSWYKSNK
jgi:hypothetical protein